MESYSKKLYGGIKKMKIYTKPEVQVMEITQAEAIATVPWGSFAPDLDELGGSITSYQYGSGATVGGAE